MSDSYDFLILLSLVLIAFLIEQENAMRCNNRDDSLGTLWKFQYFRRPIYSPVEHL